jgi:hypothetical protein
MDEDSSHYCVCTEGRTGSHCEQEVDPCLAQPCQYGGTCRGYMGGYVCEVRVYPREREEKLVMFGCDGAHVSVCLWPGVGYDFSRCI